MKTNSPPAGKGPRRDPDKEAFWRKTLSELAAGGQNVRSFCRQRELSEPALYAWRRAIRERDGERRVIRPRRRKAATAPAFVPMVMRSDDAASQIIIDLRGGRTLKLPVSLPAERLAAIINAIEAAA